MATISEIRDKIKFNREFIDLLEVMKNIAIFRFRALQRKRERFTVMEKALEGFFDMLEIEYSDTSHFNFNPIRKREVVIMVTSDEGFMGGLNLRVIDAGLRDAGPDGAELIVIGERGGRHLQEMGKTFTPFKAADFESRYDLAADVTGHVLKGLSENRFERVVVAYPKPISFMVQTVEIMTIFPVKEMYKKERTSLSEEIIVESPIGGILEYLVERFINHKLLEVLEESKLSEYAARALHLEKSGRDLVEKGRYYRLKYFHVHHELIDKGTRELYSAQIIRRKG